MRVEIIKFNQQYNRFTFKRNVSFRGVNIDNYNPTFIDAKNGLKGSELVNKFNKELNKIRKAASDKKGNVDGLFKKRKIRAIEHDEDKEISGFLLAQNAAVDEQLELVRVLQENVRLLEERNATKEELYDAKKALSMAQDTIRISKQLSQRKSSHKGFDAIAGYEKEKFILTKQFTNLLPYEQAGAEINLPECILFYGPTGNGKTSFAKAFAQSAGCLYEEAKVTVRSRARNIQQKHKEEEESLYKDLLDKAKVAQNNFLNDGVRTIILLDEIDRVGYKGSFIEEKLKKFIEKCSNQYHCTVFATTNNPLILSNPLCSEKRMPIKVNIDPPNLENAKAIFRHYLKECPNVNLDSIDLDALANEICSVRPDRAYNASNIEKIVEDCAKNYQILTQDDIIYEIRKKEPGIKKDALEKYKKEIEQLGGYVDIE